MIRCIYQKVQSCVKLSEKSDLSYFFDVSIGLKQGEPLSPILFILFINDIVENIDLESLTDTDLEFLTKYMILFADDLVLFTTSPVSLQAQVNSILRYSEKWGLTINFDKTKVCVFEKRKSKHDCDIFINGRTVEIVDSFTYLGLKFYYTGSFIHAVRALNEQAQKAYHTLLKVFDKVSLDIKTKVSLFDSLVLPILLYGAEVWGVYSFKDIDKLHVRFLKYLLGVKQQTPNFAVLGEFGRLPLSVLCKQRTLKFWSKIMSNDQSPIHDIYLDQCNNVAGNCWSKRLHSIIDHLGYTNIRLNFNRELNNFSALKLRLNDQFVQEWHHIINNLPKLSCYRSFKRKFCFEAYLDKIQNQKLLKSFARFRLSSHELEIETGRFSNIPRDERFCKMCNSGYIKTEFHFLLCCPTYNDMRREYFGNNCRPTQSKFISLMSCNSKKKILNISKYISICLDFREAIYNSCES